MEERGVAWTKNAIALDEQNQTGPVPVELNALHRLKIVFLEVFLREALRDSHRPAHVADVGAVGEVLHGHLKLSGGRLQLAILAERLVDHSRDLRRRNRPLVVPHVEDLIQRIAPQMREPVFPDFLIRRDSFHCLVPFV